jgi:cytochrome c oxidase accessory protein FixG
MREQGHDITTDSAAMNIIASDAGVPAEVGEIDLYQKREKIYTRAIEGHFQRIRLYTGWPLLLGYFLLPWLNWNGRQAVWFDLPGRKFHILGLTLWPQDFPLLAWLLIIAAFTLFAVTVWVGRVWCGYTCPQTVWTAIFMWAEQIAEGSRNQRIKLDRAPLSAEKIARKTLKHSLWFGFALLTGITFVGYFSPIRDMALHIFSLRFGFWEVAWTVFFTGATYINAGWLREQVCLHMCPYARFQSVMFDADTLIVAYDTQRGEPRGARKKQSDPRSAGKLLGGNASSQKSLGDCIDCRICVQVCPTGIDIRDGLQYQCINCALCIDGCDSVMDKMGYARGLIRYATDNELNGKPVHRLLRPRLIGYVAVIAVMTGLFAWNLATRIPAGLDVLRDRNRLFRSIGEDTIENSYTLKVLNKDERSHVWRVRVDGLPDAEIIGKYSITVAGGDVVELPLRLRVPLGRLHDRKTDVRFTVEALDDTALRAQAISTFVAPLPPS